MHASVCYVVNVLIALIRPRSWS